MFKLEQSELITAVGTKWYLYKFSFIMDCYSHCALGKYSYFLKKSAKTFDYIHAVFS